MAEEQTIKAVFIGKKFIFIGDAKITNGEEGHFKPIGELFSRFVPVRTGMSKIPYQERELALPGKGGTGQMVHVYFEDLYGDRYFAMANPQDMATIANLKIELDSAKMEIERLTSMLYDVSGDDRLIKRIEKDTKRYALVRGGYNPNAYGFGSPMLGGNPILPMGGGGEERDGFG